MKKFNPKYICKGCGSQFESKQAHGCLNRENFVKIIGNCPSCKEYTLCKDDFDKYTNCKSCGYCIEKGY